MEETCKNCESELNYAETEVSFYDEGSGETLDVTLGAYFCGCCGYNRIVRA